MKNLFILSIILKNIIYLTLIYNKINAADVTPDNNKHTVSFINECTLIYDLKKIRIELNKFIGNKTTFKEQSSHQEANKAINEQNYKHFEDAQRLLIQTISKITPMNPQPEKPMDRKNKIIQLFKLNEKLPPGILIFKYMHVLECFYAAYLKINQNNFKFFESAVSKEFISAFVTLHDKVHILTYIQLYTVTEIQALSSLDDQNIILEKKIIKPLKHTILNSLIIKNYMTLARLLVLAYKYPIHCKVNIEVTPFCNPIIIALDIIKTADISIYNIEKVAVIILDELFILLFNDAGIKFTNKKGLYTFFFYSESSESILGVSYTNLILCEHKKTTTDDVYLEYIDKTPHLYPYPTIEHLYEVFSFNSKHQIIKQTLSLIFFGCDKIDLEKMRYMWIFVLVRYQGNLTTSYRYEIFTLLSRIVSHLPTQNNDYYVEICHLTIFNIIWCLYKIYLKAMIPNNSMGLLFYFLEIVQSIKSQDSDKFNIFQDQLNFLNQLLQLISTHNYKNEFLNELFGIYDVIVKTAHNICRLYNSIEDLGYINCILGGLLEIHTTSILFIDTNKILGHIENFLSRRIISCFLPISKKAINKSLKNIICFLELSTNEGYTIKKSFKERMAIISLHLFFMLIDLQVTLKKGQSCSTDSENLETIVNHLLNNKFDMLEFKPHPNELSIINDSKYVNCWKYNYKILMNTTTIIKITHNKQFYENIGMVILNVIQIRIRLPQEIKNLLQLTAYNLIKKSKIFTKLINDIKSNIGIDKTQFIFKNPGDIFLFDALIASIFPLNPKNTYEMCLYTFLDVLCAIHRSKLANNILVSKLDQIIIDLNNLDYQLNALDFDNLAFFPEKWTIFKNLYIAIEDLSSLPLNSTKKPHFYVDSLISPIKSIKKKLEDMFKKKKLCG